MGVSIHADLGVPLSYIFQVDLQQYGVANYLSTFSRIQRETEGRSHRYTNL